jgi:hypothetical protein
MQRLGDRQLQLVRQHADFSTAGSRPEITRLEALDEGFNGIGQNRKTIKQFQKKMLNEEHHQEDLFLENNQISQRKAENDRKGGIAMGARFGIFSAFAVQFSKIVRTTMQLLTCLRLEKKF